MTEEMKKNEVAEEQLETVAGGTTGWTYYTEEQQQPRYRYHQRVRVGWNPRETGPDEYIVQSFLPPRTYVVVRIVNGCISTDPKDRLEVTEDRMFPA